MNSVSEPPIINTKPDRAPTFADVAMRLVNDGPMYAAIALVGVLSLQGRATASEMVITALASLLARSWPRAVTTQGQSGHGGRFGIGVLPLIVGGAIFAKTLACSPPPIASSPTSSPTHVHASIAPR
jgi:hypothetical protein